MPNPENYSKRILLAASGMSPQIVTETLYSLAQQVTNQFIPTEIHLITTQSGAKEARLQLLHQVTGKFWQLCKDYSLPCIDFQEPYIHVIEDCNGQSLDDIQTPEQNEIAADFITSMVSELTRHDNLALHVSIAGGRKTMGYYLGYALSLYGRPQDRLSHVLVTDRYEGLKDFFYPTPYSHVIYDRNNRALDTRDAQVMLAEIPFVRLRGGIPERLLENRAGFNESIKFARQIEAEPQLIVDKKSRSLYVADIIIPLTEVNFIFYIWMLKRSLAGETVQRLPYVDNIEYAKEFLDLYRKILPQLKDDDRTRHTLSNGMTNQWLSERISLIKRDFIKALGKHAAQPYIIHSSGNNNKKQYHIALNEDQIIHTY